MEKVKELDWYELENNEVELKYITRKVFGCNYLIEHGKEQPTYKVYFWDRRYFLVDTTETLEDAKTKAQKHFEEKVSDYIYAKK